MIGWSRLRALEHMMDYPPWTWGITIRNLHILTLEAPIDGGCTYFLDLLSLMRNLK